jgi:hypothetical protein
VRGRTATVVDAVRVGHVGFVIGRVEVYTIPARREKDLSPEAIWAVGVGESWSPRCRRTIGVDAGRSFRSNSNREGPGKILTRAKRWPWIPGSEGHFGDMGFQ